MLSEFTTWLLSLVIKVVGAIFDVMVDVAIKVVDLLLTAVVALAGAIPVPSFLSSGMNSLWTALDPGIIYLANAAGVPAALTMIGAAYIFRLGRKVVTLFQW